MIEGTLTMSQGSSGPNLSQLHLRMAFRSCETVNLHRRANGSIGQIFADSRQSAIGPFPDTLCFAEKIDNQPV